MGLSHSQMSQMRWDSNGILLGHVSLKSLWLQAL